ncbi:MAG: hypothetical protein AUK47_25355 [Deltaproteobacteria bacterium CG2_30_63_29]|nr:MAG: hypothetical protein AUK47_25355 [Deltaproteobacteria bacterium CG2_30_63_29]
MSTAGSRSVPRLFPGLIALLALSLSVACETRPKPEPKPAATEPVTARTNSDRQTAAQSPRGELLESLSAQGFGSVLLVNQLELPSRRRFWRFQLANNLTILLLQDHSLPVIAYQTWYRVGSRDDPAGKEGVTHLFEHLMFRRTVSRQEGEFDREMEQRGIDPDATAWLDTTTYAQLIPPKELDTVAALEAERMTQIYIGQDVLDAERAVVMRERSYRVDNDPSGTMNEMLYALAFPDHPYRNPSVGKRSSLAAIEVEDLRAIYDAYYQPANAAVVLVGDFDLAKAMTSLVRHYGPLAARTPPDDPHTDAPLLGGHNAQTLLMPIDTEVLMMGFPCPNGRDPDFEVMEVLNQVLFAEPHGSAFRELRFEKELVASTQGWVGRFKDRSLFEILATMKQGVTHEEARAIILDKLTLLRTDGPDAVSLERAKKRLELNLLRGIQDPGGYADELGSSWAIGAEPMAVFQRTERVRSVTKQDVIRVAQTYLQPRYLVEVLGKPASQ